MSNSIVQVKQATITYPNGFPQMLKMSEQEFVSELQFLAAAKMYELGRLSSGKAAQLAGIERGLFLQRLGQIGVAAINLRDERGEVRLGQLESGQMNRWVVDTGPLIFLAKLDRLELLQRGADEILAPPAVLAEVHMLL